VGTQGTNETLLMQESCWPHSHEFPVLESCMAFDTCTVCVNSIANNESSTTAIPMATSAIFVFKPQEVRSPRGNIMGLVGVKASDSSLDHSESDVTVYFICHQPVLTLCLSFTLK
jgi:hypothetical protein